MTIITKDLLQQQVRRHMTKCLIGLLPKVDALLGGAGGSGGGLFLFRRFGYGK